MTEIRGKSILVRVSARFELARVRVIGSRLYLQQTVFIFAPDKPSRAKFYTSLAKSTTYRFLEFFLKLPCATIDFQKSRSSEFLLYGDFYTSRDCVARFAARGLKTSSLWTGSLFGEKNSKEREGKGGREAFSLFPLPSSPLDQRPVHRLLLATLARKLVKLDSAVVSMGFSEALSSFSHFSWL